MSETGLEEDDGELEVDTEDSQEGEVDAEPGQEEDVIGAALRETERRMLLQARPMTEEEQLEHMKTTTPVDVGIMGWCAKVGKLLLKDGKTRPGMRIRGQIVSTNSVTGKFGVQQYVVISGHYQCPQHLNKQRVKVPAVDGHGRWILGIDSTLAELPQHVGDLVDVQIEKAAIAGSGQRHSYKHVKLYPTGL